MAKLSDVFPAPPPEADAFEGFDEVVEATSLNVELMDLLRGLSFRAKLMSAAQWHANDNPPESRALYQEAQKGFWQAIHAVDLILEGSTAPGLAELVKVPE